MVVKVVVFVMVDNENFDDAQARYQQELKDNGWGYSDTVLTNVQLEEFRNKSDSARKFTKNYEHGILTGGEFDMRRLAGAY